MGAINITNFAETVRQMRAAQRAFFDTPKHDRQARDVCLNESKRLERVVDRILVEMQSPQQDMLQEPQA